MGMRSKTSLKEGQSLEVRAEGVEGSVLVSNEKGKLVTKEIKPTSSAPTAPASDTAKTGK